MSGKLQEESYNLRTVFLWATGLFNRVYAPLCTMIYMFSVQPKAGRHFGGGRLQHRQGLAGRRIPHDDGHHGICGAGSAGRRITVRAAGEWIRNFRQKNLPFWSIFVGVTKWNTIFSQKKMEKTSPRTWSPRITLVFASSNLDTVFLFSLTFGYIWGFLPGYLEQRLVWPGGCRLVLKCWNHTGAAPCGCFWWLPYRCKSNASSKSFRLLSEWQLSRTSVEQVRFSHRFFFVYDWLPGRSVWSPPLKNEVFISWWPAASHVGSIPTRPWRPFVRPSSPSLWIGEGNSGAVPAPNARTSKREGNDFWKKL